MFVFGLGFAGHLLYFIVFHVHFSMGLVKEALGTAFNNVSSSDSEQISREDGL